MMRPAGHGQDLIGHLEEQASHANGRLYIRVESLYAAAQTLLRSTDVSTLAAFLLEHGFDCRPELSEATPGTDLLLVQTGEKTAEHNVDDGNSGTQSPSQPRRPEPNVAEDEENDPERRPDIPITELGLSLRTYHALTRVGIMTVGAIANRTDDELLAIGDFGRKALHEVRTAVAEGASSDHLRFSITPGEPQPATTSRGVPADAARATTSIDGEVQEILDRFLRGAEQLSPLDRRSPLGRVLLGAVDRIEPRYLAVLALRLEETLDEVGGRLGVTRERIRQLEKRGEELLIAVAEGAAPGFAEDLSDRMGDGVVASREVVGDVDAAGMPAFELLVPMLLRALGGRNPRGHRGRIAGFWTLHENMVTEMLSSLGAELPLPDGRIPDLLLDARLPPGFPLVEVLRQPGSPAAFHEEAGVWVRPRSRHGDAAYLLLRKYKKAASADAVAEVLRIRSHTLREALRRDSRFRQLRPSGEWALVEWGEPDATQYGSTLEAAVAVLQEEGALDYEAFERAVLSRYQVSSAAVRQTLSSERIGRWEDGRIDLRDRGAPGIVEPEPRRPASLDIDDKARIIRFTLTVDRDVMRGSGIPVHPYISWWLGLRQAPTSLSFRLGGAELVVRRNLGTHSLSSLRRVAEGLGATLGCMLTITLDASRLVADVRLVCRDHSHDSRA
jgi:hypothetical protein